jgi:arginine/lysine/ornithine decarboxylase
MHLISRTHSIAVVIPKAPLAGCHLSLLSPPADDGFHVPLGLQPQAVSTRLKDLHRDGHSVCAVLVTSPTYHGVVSDVAGLAQVRATCLTHATV